MTAPSVESFMHLIPISSQILDREKTHQPSPNLRVLDSIASTAVSLPEHEVYAAGASYFAPNFETKTRGKYTFYISGNDKEVSQSVKLHLDRLFQAMLEVAQHAQPPLPNTALSFGTKVREATAAARAAHALALRFQWAKFLNRMEKRDHHWDTTIAYIRRQLNETAKPLLRDFDRLTAAITKVYNAAHANTGNKHEAIVKPLQELATTWFTLADTQLTTVVDGINITYSRLIRKVLRGYNEIKILLNFVIRNPKCDFLVTLISGTPSIVKIDPYRARKEVQSTRNLNARELEILQGIYPYQDSWNEPEKHPHCECTMLEYHLKQWRQGAGSRLWAVIGCSKSCCYHCSAVVRTGFKAIASDPSKNPKVGQAQVPVYPSAIEMHGAHNKNYMPWVFPTLPVFGPEIKAQYRSSIKDAVVQLLKNGTPPRTLSDSTTYSLDKEGELIQF